MGPTMVEGAPGGGGRAPTSWPQDLVASLVLFVEKITFPKVSFRLDSV